MSSTKANARLFVVMTLVFALVGVALGGCGSSSVKVPNVKRLTLAEARKSLAESGLKVRVANELLDDRIPKGHVISQRPRAGESVSSDTIVQLSISAGSSGITVPSVLGKDVQQATIELNELGLQVRLSRVTSAEPSGTVINQSPGAGATVPSDSNVDLTVAVNFDQNSQSAGPAPPPGDSSKGTGFVVAIDPGHQARANTEPEPIGPGSTQTKAKTAGGATGVVTGKPEYAINLAISLKLRAYLQGKGVSVVMTRMTNDVDLSNVQRAQIANRANADVAVRIHADSSTNQTMEGIRTLYPAMNAWTTPIYSQSNLAATLVQQRAAAASHEKNLGTTPRDDLTGFNWSKVPAVLVETGFLSNPADDRLLNNSASQQLIAKGIGEGVMEYLRRKK